MASLIWLLRLPYLRAFRLSLGAPAPLLLPPLAMTTFNHRRSKAVNSILVLVSPF